MERAHLSLHVANVVVGHANRPGDRRVDMVVELAAVAGEALHERCRLLQPELGRLDARAARVVLEGRLDGGRGRDGDREPDPAELGQRDRDLHHHSATSGNRHLLRGQRRTAGRDGDYCGEPDILGALPDDRDDEEGASEEDGAGGGGAREHEVGLEERLRVAGEADLRTERDRGLDTPEPRNSTDVHGGHAAGRWNVTKGESLRGRAFERQERDPRAQGRRKLTVRDLRSDPKDQIRARRSRQGLERQQVRRGVTGRRDLSLRAGGLDAEEARSHRHGARADPDSASQCHDPTFVATANRPLIGTRLAAHGACVKVSRLDHATMRGWPPTRRDSSSGRRRRSGARSVLS